MLFYRALLRLYPSSFRAEYGREMTAVFANELRDAPGPGARALLWCRAIADIVSNALPVHADILRQDLRYAARTLVRMPGFSATVILVAALGIGATTAAFSVANHVLLRPLPFPERDRLVQLWQDQSYRGYGRMELSPANYRDWKAQSTSFENIGVYTDRSANLVGVCDPVRLQGSFVTWDAAGRARGSARAGTGVHRSGRSPRARRVSWSSATERGAPSFGADPNVIGRKVLMNNEPSEVIGVMPRGFFFPYRETEFWKPVRFAPESFEDRTDTYIKPVARLRQGVTLEQARAEMDVIADRLAKAFPAENKGTGAFVHKLRDRCPTGRGCMLGALLGGSLCVLLIACTNLANLLLSRSLSRQRELAVRLALGAGMERVIRQMLTESLFLAAIGGAAGVLIAYLGNPLAARLVPTTLPIARHSPDRSACPVVRGSRDVPDRHRLWHRARAARAPRDGDDRPARRRPRRRQPANAANPFRARHRRGRGVRGAPGVCRPADSRAPARAANGARISHRRRADDEDRTAAAEIRRDRTTAAVL